jgi:hypothetical protein
MPDPPDFDAQHSPEECSIASIYLSTDSITPRCIFSVKLKLRGFHSHSPIITTCHPKMSVYLSPLTIPSRNNSMSDDSPYTRSTSPTAAWSSSTTPSRRSSEGTHFLGIPGPSAPHIKDADSVDKEANAAAAAGAATASSSPSSQGQ